MKVSIKEHSEDIIFEPETIEEAFYLGRLSYLDGAYFTRKTQNAPLGKLAIHHETLLKKALKIKD